MGGASGGGGPARPETEDWGRNGAENVGNNSARQLGDIVPSYARGGRVEGGGPKGLAQPGVGRARINSQIACVFLNRSIGQESPTVRDHQRTDGRWRGRQILDGPAAMAFEGGGVTLHERYQVRLD